MKWRCTVCGYIHDGDQAPEKCPKCGAPREKFEQVPADKAELIEKSRQTNSLWMSFVDLVETLEELSERGIEENLDPTCVQLFKKAQQTAHELGQAAKAEMQAHVNKGKWG